MDTNTLCTKKTIYLHGDLKNKFGESFSLVINTVREACNALDCMIPGFRRYVIGDKRDRYYRVIRGSLENGFDLDEQMVADFSIGNADIHIVPIIQGAKDSGIGKIIFGALLFGAGALMGFGKLGFTMTGAAATTGVQVARLGVGIALAGIGQMLSPSPSAVSSESAETRESFIFNGAINRSTQGCAIPITYGKFLVGSVVVSAGISTEDVLIDTEASDETPTPKNLNATIDGDTLRITWGPAFVAGEYDGAFNYTKYEYNITDTSNDSVLFSDLIDAFGTPDAPQAAITYLNLDITSIAAGTSMQVGLRTAMKMTAYDTEFSYSEYATTSVTR